MNELSFVGLRRPCHCTVCVCVMSEIGSPPSLKQSILGLWVPEVLRPWGRLSLLQDL